MTPRSCLALALFSLMPPIYGAKPGIIQVTSVRAWTHASATRVILETTGPFEFRVDRATHPDRLFFDILNASPWIDGKRLAIRQVDDPLVQRVRVAETAPGTTRVVFDLTGPVSFTVSKLDAPDRMVIEVRPFGSPPPSVTTTTTTTSHAGPKRQFVPPPAQSQRYRSVVYAGQPPQLPAAVPSNWVLPESLVVYLPRAPKASRKIEAIMTPPSSEIPPPVPYNPPVVAKADSTARAAPPGPGPRVQISAPDMGMRSMTRALGLKVSRVVIDAGHGGHDEGTSGPHGVLEKDVVLDVALRLAKLVETRLGAEVVLTRADDTFIPLTERTAIANARRADLFVSIHANSSPVASVAGTETFYLNFTGNPTALDVASRENSGADKSIAELHDLIQSITLNDKITESQTLAQHIQNSIYSQAAKANVSAKNRGVKRAPFVVLIGASMPSILAEIGFLTNPRDEANLGKADYRQKIAEALYRGVAQYSQSLGSTASTSKVSSKLDKPERRSAGAN